jgi:hypothetical protein
VAGMTDPHIQLDCAADRVILRCTSHPAPLALGNWPHDDDVDAESTDAIATMVREHLRDAHPGAVKAGGDVSSRRPE